MFKCAVLLGVVYRNSLMAAGMSTLSLPIVQGLKGKCLT